MISEKKPDENCAERVLLIGYGNPGRIDDGLGPALAEKIERLKLPGITVDVNYQLTVEDAAEAARHDVVIFADASVKAGEPFEFKEIEPNTAVSFTSHSFEPELVLGLARELFKAKTKGYALGIRGYRFDDFGEYLSKEAESNLQAAFDFIKQKLAARDF